MKQTVSRFGCAAIAALFGCSPMAAGAQEKPANYPLRPVRIIVGIAPGGGLDSTTRLVAQMVSDKWGQTVVVDNRPGAGTVIAAELASQAPPDGYTLLMATNTLALLGAQKRVSFDVRKTFVPVAWAVTQPYVMVANPSLPVKSPKDLVAHSKAKPGTVTYGSSGVGTTLHLGMEKLAALTGASFEHVPYKGTAPALLAVIAGEIQILAGSSIATLPHVKTGKLRGLGVMGPKRIAAAPDLPTFAEALGLAGFEVTNSYGLFAPAGTPAPIVEGLNRIVLSGMRTPEVLRKVQSDGAEPAEPGTPAELKVKFARDFAEAEKLIKQLKVKFY